MKRFQKLAVIVFILALVLCFASCKKEEFTVSFDSAGGTSVAAVKVEEESLLTEPAAPAREGYRFEGWYLGETKWSFATPVTSNLTLTAKWTPITYGLEFSLGGGTLTGTLPTEYTVESESISIPNPTRRGYAFMGWTFEGATAPVKDLVIAKGTVGNRAYTATWELITYHAEIDPAGGGMAVDFPTDKYTLDFTVESESVSIVNPWRKGYTFAGWSCDGSTELIKDLMIRQGSVGSRSYVAVWTLDHYEININLGGGTPGGNYPTDYTVEDGVITIAAPTRDGYTFAGWTFEGASEPVMNLTIAAGSIGNKTYTATWTVITYNITVNLGGGTAGGTYPTDYTIEGGSIVLANPTRPGYDFDGWSVNGETPVKDLTIAAGSFGNKTLDAVWTVVEYKITINLGGGTAGGFYPTTYNVENGVISIADPTRAGYTFAGWDFEGADEPVKNLSFQATELGDKTFTAVWITIRYNITINLGGGEPGGEYPPDYTVEDGVISIQNPTKPGYAFGGWEIDGAGEPVKDLKLDSSEMEDKTLTAVWIVIEYKITVNFVGGSSDATYPTKYTVEDGSIVLSAPTKEHYTFGGWEIDGEIYVTIPVELLKDLVVNAVWTPVEYNVQYNNCGTDLGGNKTTYTVEDEFELLTPVLPGYTFDGWFADAKLTQSVSSVTLGSSGTLTFWAKWTVVTYDITYDLDGGELEGENPATYTVLDALSLIAPTKEGYTFVGWSLDGKTVTSIPAGTVGDLELKAIWKLFEYSITYETNGGTNDGANPDVFNVESEFEFLDAFRQGYDFVGWFADEACTVPMNGVVAGTKGDFKVYAKWTPIAYKITVDLQHGALAEGDTIPETYTVEDGAILLPIPTREHYVFVGWLVNGGEKDKIPADFWGDVTVEAVWKLRDYKITYVLGGGANNAENIETYTVQDFFRFKDPTREGYTFAGWYTDAELTTAIYDLGLGKGGDVTVYAKWTPISYTITYVLYDGTNAESNPLTFTAEDLPLRLGEATKYNLFFDAWYTEEGFENAVVVINSVGDIMLYARFVPATEGVNYTLSEDGTYYIVTGYEGSETKVIIASTHEDLPVKKIAAYAFQNASHVTEIVIPTSVEVIEMNALYGCNSLEKLTVPFIGGTATDYNTFGYIFGASGYRYQRDYIPQSLKTVIVTAGELKSYAFYDCRYIETVEFRTPLTQIPEYAFYNCTAMTTFPIPETVTFIGQNAFYGWSGWLYIPETVERIQNYAFQNAGQLKVYFAHESLPESFDSSALYDLNYYYFNATTATGSTAEGYSWLLLRDGSIAITGYTGDATELEIPEEIGSRRVTAIGNSAFRNNDTITKVTVPDTVQSIGKEAFIYCSSMTEVYIPASVKFVGGNAFWSNYNMTKVEVHAEVIDFNAFGALSNLETLIIGDGVRVIGDGVFQQASKLTEITVPDSVESIGDGAFEYLRNLKKITLPFVGASREAETYKAVFGYIFGYTETSSYANGIEQYYGRNDNNQYRYFYYNIPTSLEEVVITDGEVIAENAFKNCSMIKKASIHADMETLPKLFSGCNNLEEVAISGNVKKIGESAFYSLDRLRTVSFEGVEEIGNSAFRWCGALESVDLSGIKTLGEYAFSECYSLAEVNFGDALETIGDYAFGWNDGLKEINLPDSVKTIGNYAFYDSELVTANLGNNVETIGEQAFYCSYSLKEVYIPETVTLIGADAFHGCNSATLYLKHDAEPAGWGARWNEGVTAIVWGYTGIRGETEDGFVWILDKSENVTITAYTGNDTEVTVPSTIEGYPVTAIGSKVFSSRGGSITKVTLPEGITHIGDNAFSSNFENMVIVLPSTVTHIGDYAFNNVYTLTELPSSLEYIGNYAFSYCFYMTELKLPEGLKVIGDYAFVGCYQLIEVELPSSLESIGLGAFHACTALERITVPFIGKTADGTENRYFAYIFGAESYYDTDRVPETLKSITVNASEIPMYAFYYMNDVTDITFTKSVEVIGDYAFYYCISLTKLTLPEGVKRIGAYALRDTQITEFDFSSAEFIGDYAFANTPLESVNFSDALTHIGAHSFGATKLQGTLTVPASVTELGSYAFANTPITEANLLCGIERLPEGFFKGCDLLKKVTVPQSVNAIGNNVFEGCKSLTDFDFTNIVSIGNDAFSGCTGLRKLSFEGTAVQTLSGRAFFGCTGLVEIDFGNTVSSIGASAFENCSSLVKVRLGTSVSSIGSYAFRYCYKLYDVCNDSALTLTKGNSGNGSVAYYAKNLYSTSSGSSCLTETDGFLLMNADGKTTLVSYVGEGGDVVVPDTVTAIDASAFANRSDITSVKLPEGLKTIGERAFENCTGLKEIYVPAGVTKIGQSAFAGCDSLEKITLPFAGYDLESINSYDHRLGYIFGVSSSSSQSYTPRSLKTIVILGGNVVPSYAFANFEFVENIVLPNGITSIGSCAFQYCGALKSVNLPAGLTEIPSNAFQYCESLVSIEIPETVTTIGQLAFDGCSSLKEISLPNGLTTIASAAFRNCTSLTQIVIPSSVTTIGHGAFQYCSSLAEITVPFVGATPTSNSFFGYIFGAGSYSNNATYVPKSLKRVVVTGGTTLSYGAFYGCSSIESITLPEGLKELPGRVFYNCYGLEEVVIPNTVTSIASEAFKSCTGLKELIIPSSVEYIHQWAIDGCSGLKMLYVPGTVQTIDSAAICGFESGLVVCVGAAEKPSGWNDNWLSDSYGYATVVWNAQKQTYTFQTNGGTEIPSVTDYVVTEFPVPTKDGYYFGGWYGNADLEGDPILNGSYYSADQTVLYAKWLTAEEYEEWADGSSLMKAYALTLGENLRVYAYSFWSRYTPETDGKLDIYYHDGAYRAANKSIYVYDENGTMIYRYDLKNVYGYTVTIDVEAGKTVFIKTVASSYYNTCTVCVSEHIESDS